MWQRGGEIVFCPGVWCDSQFLSSSASFQYKLLRQILPKLHSWQRRFCVKAWGWKRRGDLEEDRAMQYCWYCVSFCWILSSFFICLTSAVALLVGEKLQEEATLVVSAGQFHHLRAQMWWCENTDSLCESSLGQDRCHSSIPKCFLWFYPDFED